MQVYTLDQEAGRNHGIMDSNVGWALKRLWLRYRITSGGFCVSDHVQCFSFARDSFSGEGLKNVELDRRYRRVLFTRECASM